MIGRDMLAQEVEQLKNTKTSLQAATKASEVRLTDLREQVVLKEYECRQALAVVQETFELERAALSHAVVPLREETERLKERVATEERRVKALVEKHMTIAQQQQERRSDMEKQIEKQQATLQTIEASIARHKAVVAAM
jgi:chromosome segregation ATPase